MKADTCLGNAELRRFLEGGATGEQLARVREHLSGCTWCSGILRILDSGPYRPLTLPDAILELSPGAKVDRFRIVRELGRGATGVVYLAEDPRLERKIAIKWLHAQEGEAQERMEREAKALAKLNHPNVVGVYDVGLHEGRLFMAMEYVEGLSLRAWFESVTRTREEILEKFIQAGQGLLAAHLGGVIHRDFKPDNVLVGADDRVRVVDFGLARQTNVWRTTDALAATNIKELTLSHTGAILGTPAYMAPEQFFGGSVGARTDQFAYCVSLAEALYGKRPFDADSLHALMQRVCEAPPEFGSNSDPGMERVLRRGLARESDLRYPSLAPLLDDLRVLRERTKGRSRSRIGTSFVAAAAVLSAIGWFAARTHSGGAAIVAKEAVSTGLVPTAPTTSSAPLHAPDERPPVETPKPTLDLGRPPEGDKPKAPVPSSSGASARKRLVSAPTARAEISEHPGPPASSAELGTNGAPLLR